MKKKIILFSILILSALFLFSSANAMTETERQAAIAQLQQQIAQLQAQLAQLLASSSAEWCHDFNTNIKYGNIGTEVAHLQVALQKNGFSIASNETQTQAYYDSTTYAVNGFQEKYASEILWPLGLTQGTGFVGALTRAKLNQLYGCAGGENPPPTPCTPGWYCTAWSTCANGQQTRTCTDYNNCGVTTNRPATTQACSSSCTPSWACASWSTCSNGTQTRSCTDANNCGITTNKPITTQSCTATCTPNWSCGTWGTCSNNQQTRTCTDLNSCGVTTNKPATTQTCSSGCAGNWTCTPWSVCLNSQQTRTCTDLNNCTNASNKPATTQVCDFSSCTGCCPNWSCNPWSACANSQQTRICVDLNHCNSTVGAPAQTRACVANPNCVSNWGCSDWGYCVYPQGASKGEQVRTCFDLNLCTDQQPVQKQDCTCAPTWDCKYQETTDWSECVNGQHTRTCRNTTEWCQNPATKPAESEACVTVDLKVSTPKISNSDGPIVYTRDPRIVYIMAPTDFTLSWTTSGATSCTASLPSGNAYASLFQSWPGTKTTSGSQAMGYLPNASTPFFSWNFIITCTGPGGSATDSVQVSYAPYVFSIILNESFVNGNSISWTGQDLGSMGRVSIVIYPADRIYNVTTRTWGAPPPPMIGDACTNCKEISYLPYGYSESFRENCEGNSKSGQCLTVRMPINAGGGALYGYIVSTNIISSDSGESVSTGIITGVGSYYNPTPAISYR